MRHPTTLLALLLAALTACIDPGDPEISRSQDELYLPPVCIPLVYNVDDDAGPGGNGSAAAPFRSIHEALTAARSAGLCAVTVDVASGTYTGRWGTLSIDRPTTVRGASRYGVRVRARFYNSSGKRLRIERLTIENAYAGVTSWYSPTEIYQATIRSVRTVGVDQVGSSLSLSSSSIYDLTGETETLSTPAIRVRGGASASLYSVYTSRATQGLSVTGAGSTAYATYLRAYYHGGGPYNLARCGERDRRGAIEVGHGAAVHLVDPHLYRNAGYGLHAHDGAALTATGATVRDTLSGCGADGANLSSGAYLGLDDFVIDGGGCGLALFGDPGTDLSLTAGTIRSQLDAAVCVIYGFANIRTLLADVILEDNAREVADQFLPPGTSLPPPTPIDEG